MLTIEHVASCFEGPAVDRGEAIERLTAGQLVALFPASCDCGINHRIAADNLARAWRGLDPSLRTRAKTLGARAFIAAGAVRGATSEETRRRQILAMARSRLPPGVKPSRDGDAK